MKRLKHIVQYFNCVDAFFSFLKFYPNIQFTRSNYKEEKEISHRNGDNNDRNKNRQI